MTTTGVAQILIYLVVLTAAAVPLGRYMAWVFAASPSRRPFAERAFLRLIGSDGAAQDWKQYAQSLTLLGLAGAGVLYLLLRLQGHLPLNPEGFAGVGSVLSLHTTASFVSSTNWQFYGGESTMSHLAQMSGLAVQNFIAPGVGLAVFAAVVRGLARRQTSSLGNIWVDLYRSVAYVLLPLAVVATVILAATGVPQTFAGYASAETAEGSTQEIARGPVASQVAIRTLGTNGGGFFNTNGATPFENPTALSNFVLPVLQLLIPAACVFMFGRMVGSRRQARLIYAVMVVLVVVGVAVAVPAEQHASPVLRESGVDLTQGGGQSGGNMADKEVRLGASTSAVFTSVTTSSSGSGIDAGHDAMTPAGGGVPLVNMFVGVVGGVGSGMWSMLLKILLTVFVASLMIGRTPQFLGKKIEAREMKLVAVGLLFVPVLTLAATALSVVTADGRESIFNPGAHGFTETLYAYTSQANNNGSAFAGFRLTDLAAFAGTFVMLLGRYVPIVVVLALAGSLAAKQSSPPSAGTLRTDSATFGAMLVGVILVMTSLTILPALALGPVVEALGG